MESNTQNSTVVDFNPLLGTSTELVDHPDDIKRALLTAYSEASPVVQIKVIANVFKNIRPDLKKEDLNQFKASYCKLLIDADDSELGRQDSIFKIAVELKERASTDEQWIDIYDQVDQRFREIFSDYKSIESF